jgi:hypothetical protein
MIPLAHTVFELARHSRIVHDGDSAWWPHKRNAELADLQAEGFKAEDRRGGGGGDRSGEAPAYENDGGEPTVVIV